MGQCHATLLHDRGVVRVAGTDAHKFLQGLITNDIGKARDDVAVHAGLLSPQGKILFDFFVVAADSGYLVDVARDKMGELAKRLGFYKLRAAVEVSEEPAYKVMAAWATQPNPSDAIVYADPRLADLGYRLILRAGESELGCTPVAEEDYHARRIGLGVPEGGRDYAFGDTFPHEALFDQLDGVDFKKGCFVGQEVVSRMEHRGTARKRIVPVEGEGTLPASGASIVAGEVPIGSLGSVNGRSGLALIRLDRAEEALARGAQLFAGDVRIALRHPAFARFAIPVAGVPA
jgi:folate-binding protein YgfZ